MDEHEALRLMVLFDTCVTVVSCTLIEVPRLECLAACGLRSLSPASPSIGLSSYRTFRTPLLFVVFRLRYLCEATMLLVAAHSVHAITGVDVSQAVSESTWKCLMSPGGQGPVEFAIVRVYQSGGHADPNGASTIKAARAAGVKHVDGYIFPCFSCGDAAGQVKATVTALSGAEYGMLWYDIEIYKWSSDKAANQEFIKAMIDEGASLCIRGGIYSSRNSWDAIVGSSWTYAKDAGLPIWYAHYDGLPAFSDFSSFGGWTAPAIKQYLGDKSSCGAGVDYNWYPSATPFEYQPRLPPQLPLSKQAVNVTVDAATPPVGVNGTSCGWVAYKQCDSRWAQESLGTSTSNTICKVVTRLLTYVCTAPCHHSQPKAVHTPSHDLPGGVCHVVSGHVSVDARSFTDPGCAHGA